MEINFIKTWSNFPIGYCMTLTEQDVTIWQYASGRSEPPRTLIAVHVHDEHGEVVSTPHGLPVRSVKDIVADFLPPFLQHLWPTRKGRPRGWTKFDEERYKEYKRENAIARYREEEKGP